MAKQPPDNIIIESSRWTIDAETIDNRRTSFNYSLRFASPSIAYLSMVSWNTGPSMPKWFEWKIATYCVHE